MAVVASPFGRKPSGNQPIPPRPEPEENNARRKAENFLKLEKTVDTAIQRVRETPNERLSAKEKQAIIAEIEKLAKQGGTGSVPSDNVAKRVLGFAGDIASKVVAPFAPRNNQVSDVILQGWRAAQRPLQSVAKEYTDLRISQGEKPFQFKDIGILTGTPAGVPVFSALQALGVGDKKLDPKYKQALAKQTKLTGDTYKPSLKDLVSQIADSEWKYKKTATAAAVREVSPVVGVLSELGVEMVADPVNYVTGVGNVKYVGRLGKLSLAQRLTTTKMIETYPQLANAFNDIVRYGQNAPIAGFKDILKAEGIETGVRVLGKMVKGTERISQPVGLAVSSVWEKAMDLATALRNSKLVFSPSSRAFMMDVGRRTGGAYRLTEPTALSNVAQWSARQFAKGVVPAQLNRFESKIRETIKSARQQGLVDELPDLVERANPYTYRGAAVFAALPENQQKLVREYVDWQNEVYAETEAVYKQFGVDFGTDVPDFSWIDDYVFHKVSKEAAQWIAENGTKGKKFERFFMGGQLDAADITDLAAPLRYRKYRAQQVLPDGTLKTETFMDEPVIEGTIKELNDIFKRKTGTDIKFFETDAGVIAQSYAYSMAKMRGREAYIRRLMDYGDTAAAKLLHKTIPDPVLRAAAKTELDEILAVRNGLRTSLGRNMNNLVSVIKQGVKDAEALVNGNLKQRKLNKATTDAAIKRIETLQDNIVKLRGRADELAIEKRGEFDSVYSAMLTNLQNLKVSLLSGTSELDEIRLGLQTTYASMYPTATKISDDIEELADKISAAKGIPATREGRAINKQITELRAQLDALSPTSEEYAQLSAEVARLRDIDNGYRVMAEYRMAQDYAPNNGFLYITGREMAETDEMQIGMKLLRTSARGFPDQGDVMAVRVFGNEEVIDSRSTGGVARIFGVNDFGDGLVEQLGVMGIDATPLRDALDAVRVGLPMDPELERAFPEIADLIKLMEGNQSREIMPYGDPQLIKAIYEEFVDTATGLLLKVGVDNADFVARNMVDSALGYVADVGIETNSARGLMLPAMLFDDAAEMDDIVVLLAPRVALQATDSVTGPVQDASSPLIQAIMRTDEESAANASRARLNELASRKAEIDDTSTAVKQELVKLNRRKAGLKGAATKRKNAAAVAKERAGAARNLPREIIIDGKPVKMTLAQIDKRLEALTATEQRLRANMERTLAREQAAIREGGLTLRGAEAQVARNTDRLRVLFDEALALSTWDMGAGMMVRDDIAAGIDLIASMPPTGVAGDATRNWLASVQRGVESGSLIKDPSVRTAYERLHQLVAYDEWNLSLADEALADATRALEDLDTGRFGAVLDTVAKRTLEGWEAIDGLGVQVPDELMKIWKPNLEKILAKQNRGFALQSLDYLNKLFKTYAIGTVGFVVRNLYSALFMNAVAGVDPQTMAKGYRAALYYNRYGAAKWLDELGVVGAEREMYEQAMLAVESTGRRGFFSELTEPVVAGTKRAKVANAFLNNPYTKAVRAANTRVEDAVRFPLALKAIQDGDDYVGAASQVARYHFDYTDLSQVDEFALKFIPFWIWTTRNLPNQLANQWMRPQVYSLWEDLQQSLPADDNVLMPKWMQDYEPMSLARFGMPNVLLRPDLPHQRLDKTIRELTSLRGLAGQSYPILKLPLESWSGKNAALDIPFSNEPREAKGFDAVTAAILNALGKEGAAPKQRDASGKEQQMITDFPSYAVGNMLPIIATLQRLTGGYLGGKESYADRMPSAWATFLGAPVDIITDRMQGSEAYGRTRNIGDLTGELSKLGLIEKADEVKARKKEAKEANEAAQKASRNDLINEASAELLRIKELYGTKSDEYKAAKQRLADLKSPNKAQKRIDEENIILRFGEGSLEHQRWIEENVLLEKGD